MALRGAAEDLVAEGGPEALSVRAVADRAGTTTRAVYSLFGSRDGLVAAVAQTAFEFLFTEMAKVPETDDPAEDLIACGTDVFRRLVIERPGLYRIAFQRVVGLTAAPDLASARERAYRALLGRTERLQSAGMLGAKSVAQAALEINALFEGLGNAELRGEVLRMLPAGREQQAWREALQTVIRGLATTPGP